MEIWRWKSLDIINLTPTKFYLHVIIIWRKFQVLLINQLNILHWVEIDDDDQLLEKRFETEGEGRFTWRKETKWWRGAYLVGIGQG